MAAKRKKAKKYIFYPIYWCLTLIAVGAILLMMRVLWDNMEDYESTMPKYVAAEVEKIFTQRDFAALYQHDEAISLCQGESEADYVEYLERLTSGFEIVCKESFSMNPDEKSYQVKFGPNKLAVFTLGKSGEKTEFGYELWELKSIKTSFITPREYRITVPETSSVYADGQLLGEEYVAESGMVFDTSYLPSGYEHTKWKTYAISRCFSVPKFEVKDKEGRPQVFMPDEQGRLIAEETFDDEKMRESVEEYVFTVAKMFARFTSDDCYAERVLRYVMNDSKAEKYINGFDGGWFRNHRSYEFLNMRTEKYICYSDTVFSCSVYFDYKINYDRGQSEIYPTGYTFYFQKHRDNWLLFDFTTVD